MEDEKVTTHEENYDGWGLRTTELNAETENRSAKQDNKNPVI